MRLVILAACAVAVSVSACAFTSSSDDHDGDSASSENELAVDRVPLPTTRTTLLAGSPYTPVVDGVPLTIAGAEPCLVDPQVRVTPGATAVDAAFASNRSELLRKLDFSVDAGPIDLPKLAQVTGSAKLALETKFHAGSINLVFQAKGTYETELTGLGATPMAFSAERVPQCGWGYVRRARHRLGALVVVTIEAADASSLVAVGTGDAPISAGPVQAKAALETVLKRGSFNISIRTAADIVPDLPPTPLGEISALTSTPETYAPVLEKLGRALDWLADAETKIAARIEALRSDPAQAAAPTTQVEFSFYSGLSAQARADVDRSFDTLLAARAQYQRNAERAAAWRAFEEDRATGRGHLYNVPTRPAKNVDELAERASQLLGGDGLLVTRMRELDGVLHRCEDALRNGQAACEPIGEAAFEPTFDVEYAIKRLAVLSAAVREYDKWRDDMCPIGQRLPTRSEADLLSPFSFVAPAITNDGGIWLQRDGALSRTRWITNGSVEEQMPFASPRGLALCFNATSRAFE